MKKLVIIGVDAMAWKVFESIRSDLPFFDMLATKHNYGLLISNVKPLHSVYCWYIAMTGKMPNYEHNVYERWPTPDEVEAQNPQWIWDRANNPYVRGLPVSAPGLYINCDPHFVDEEFAPVTDSEFDLSAASVTAGLIEALQGPYDFIYTCYTNMDRAGHLYLAGDPSLFIGEYKRIDRALEKVYDQFSKHHWVIFSDHGMTDTITSYINGWTPYLANADEVGNDISGQHDPYGVCFTNASTRPEALSHMHAWLECQWLNTNRR